MPKLETLRHHAVAGLNRWDIWCCMACLLLFVSIPDIDIMVSSWFYQGGEFKWKHQPIVWAIYMLFAKLHFVILLAGLLYLGSFFNDRSAQRQRRKRQVRFLLLVLLMGPGVVVNILLKDNSFNRPRPVHIEQFGGESIFKPILVYSDQCSNNCSFVSGHAALGFYFICLAWALNRPRWFYVGLGMGTVLAAVRLIQGGHFLSDVIFSFWAVYGTTLACAGLYRYHWRSPLAQPILLFREKREIG